MGRRARTRNRCNPPTPPPPPPRPSLKFRCARPINFHSTRLHDDRALPSPAPIRAAAARRPDNKRRPRRRRPLLRRPDFFPFTTAAHYFYYAQRRRVRVLRPCRGTRTTDTRRTPRSPNSSAVPTSRISACACHVRTRYSDTRSTTLATGRRRRPAATTPRCFT